MSKRSKRTKRRAKTKSKGIKLKKHRKFRFFRPAQHPALIICDSHDGQLEGMTISHIPAVGKKKAIRLLVNPEHILLPTGEMVRKADGTYLYIQIRRGTIGVQFSRRTLDMFILSEDDEALVDRILKARDEGKPWSFYLTEEEKARARMN